MVVSTLSGVLVIAIITQLAKSFLEAFGLNPENPLHDPIVWLIAFVTGVAGYIISAAITAPLSGGIVRDAAGQGLLAAFSAVGAYSLVTHPYFSTTPIPGQSTTVTRAQKQPDPSTATVTIGQITSTMASEPLPSAGG